MNNEEKFVKMMGENINGWARWVKQNRTVEKVSKSKARYFSARSLLN